MDDIYEFICRSLDNNIEDFVFNADSIEALGKLYFNSIVNGRPTFTAERVKSAIECFSYREEPLYSEAEYYYALCGFIGIKVLPRTVRSSVVNEYLPSAPVCFSLSF